MGFLHQTSMMSLLPPQAIYIITKFQELSRAYLLHGRAGENISVSSRLNLYRWLKTRPFLPGTRCAVIMIMK